MALVPSVPETQVVMVLQLVQTVVLDWLAYWEFAGIARVEKQPVHKMERSLGTSRTGIAVFSFTNKNLTSLPGFIFAPRVNRCFVCPFGYTSAGGLATECTRCLPNTFSSLGTACFQCAVFNQTLYSTYINFPDFENKYFKICP